MHNKRLLIIFVAIISLCSFLYACSSSNIDSALENELKSQLDGASKQERFAEISVRYRLYKARMHIFAERMFSLKKDLKFAEDAIKTSKAMGRDGAEHQATLEEFKERMVGIKNDYALEKAKFETVKKLARKYDISEDILGK